MLAESVANRQTRKTKLLSANRRADAEQMDSGMLAKHGVDMEGKEDNGHGRMDIRMGRPISSAI